MGFSLAGLGKALFSSAVSLIKTITGETRPTFEVILPKVAGDLFSGIMDASKYQDLSSKEKIDAWLLTLDKSFGSEASALDVVRTLPADKEEELTDHIIEAARVILYMNAKVPGYYQATS